MLTLNNIPNLKQQTNMIAVHCGAGKINERSHWKYNKLCKKACRAGNLVLQKGGNALEAVRAAIIVLENDPLCNAGYGSNLTRAGKVECDAAVMDGDSLIYGGCGSVPKVKNPIGLAYKICTEQFEEQPLGLIPPSLLVGNGALQFARKSGLKIVKHRDLITMKAKRQLYKCSNLLGQCNEMRMDTVGAVCCDKDGKFAAACSSGGILLKKPGRVGQAALYASGVWADSYSKTSQPSIAACTSGSGEHIVQTQLAKVISEDLQKADCPITALSKSLTDNFINSRFLHSSKNKSVGALVLHLNLNGEGNLLWGHCTENMAVGYMKTTDTKPTSLVSVLPQNAVLGTTVNVGGTNFLKT